MRRKRNSLVALGVLLACWPSVFALNPSLDVSQYAHTSWTVSQGVFKGGIWAIAQTSDGYLWLGTEFGLLRFDGVRVFPWQPPAGDHLPNNDVRSLRVARDGSLWIGTYRGLVNWKNGKLTHYPKFDGLIIEWLLEDREGTIWVVTGWTLSEARLCSIQSGETHCYGEDGGPGFGVNSIYEDSQGALWAGTMDGVLRWKPGPPTLYRLAGPAQRTYALSESEDGGILIARSGGITKLRKGKFEPYPFPPGLQFRPGRLLRDASGSLWVGALVDRGLMHIHQGRTDLFTPAGISGDLSGHNVRCLFEDREGSMWVATSAGLDRFREFDIPIFSVQQGFSSRGVSSVLAGRDGSIWLGTAGGLNRWTQGKVTIYHKRKLFPGTPAAGLTEGQLAEPGSTIREVFDGKMPEGEVQSLFEDGHGNIWVATTGGLAFLKSGRFVPVSSVAPSNVLSIAGDDGGNVWISHGDGLFHLHHSLVVDHIPWADLGHTEPAGALLHDAVRGGLWLGFRDGGVAFLRDGQNRASYQGAEAAPQGIVHSLYEDERGTLWAATEQGLKRLEDHRVEALTSQNGLPCNDLHWMMEDAVHDVWLYTACGLVRIARPDLEAWVSHVKQTIPVTLFDGSDGVTSHPSISGFSPLVAKAADGKIWFTNSDSVNVIDPATLHQNKLPPPVHIEGIVADEKAYDAQNGIRLHPHVRNLAIDYTALSLVVPEKVRFRYKLEGQNKNWHEVVNDREVQYTNLGPGTYRFHVKACNNSGVWNETGDTLEFVIPPMWYQTNWFYALCASAFLASLWAAYQLRVRQLAAQFNMRLEERVAERTRVARDLHDTLLQSFQALLPLFQSGIKKLPENAVESRERLEIAMDRASEAIGEGRDAIKGLRMSTIEKNDLARAIQTIGEELSAAENGQNSVSFELLVEGRPRELHPILRDEIYRLATEALRNCFRHADAKRVEVEIRYDEKYFRLRVRDDGKGIPSDVLGRDGREGHYGLPGMRERANLVGGKLTIWTELDSGTEIELAIPGAKVYVKSTRPFLYFGRRSATETDEKEPIERE